MHDGLERLIDDYLAAIQQAVACLEASGIPSPTSTQDWITREFDQVGSLTDGTRYFKHGYGIDMNIRPHPVDFNFGPNGEFDAVDLHFMIHFAKDRLPDYGLASREKVIEEFEKAIVDGSLIAITSNLYQLA